jgi:hypothetical protein
VVWTTQQPFATRQYLWRLHQQFRAARAADICTKILNTERDFNQKLLPVI